ncbi:MAG: IPT/TIG domain-containing protein, partial [Candidatus Binatia bacterium]
YGTGFSTTPSQNNMEFNGVAATIASSTETRIVTTVPSGATTGAIGVTTPLGSALSAVPFTVESTKAPTVTSFTPTIGLVGTPVTISRTNFDQTPNKNDARINIARGSVSSSSTTSIFTSVPTGTGSGRISVTTAFGKGISKRHCFIPPSPYTVGDVAFTGRIATDGSNLNVAIGAANKIGLVVFDAVAGERVAFRVTNSTFPWPGGARVQL